jgi:GNAT superfamily N-acetyltransferase
VNGFRKAGRCLIGRLMVHPDFQGRGIGSRLMQAIEARFDDAESWDLFTGELSVKNIRLYEQLGYRVIRKEPFPGIRFSVVFMRKMNKASPGNDDSSVREGSE